MSQAAADLLALRDQAVACRPMIPLVGQEDSSGKELPDPKSNQGQADSPGADCRNLGAAP